MIGRTPQVTCLHLLLDMVMAILPLDKGEPKKLNQELDINAILAVTKDELADICRRIRDNKAPGLDTVPNRAFPVKTRCGSFISVFDACVVEGVFPTR